MKICLVTPKLVSTDGQGRVNAELVRQLLERGHQLTLVGAVIEPHWHQHPQVRCYELPPPPWAVSSLVKDAVFAFRLAGLLARLAPTVDLVHLNGALTWYPAAVNSCHFVHSQWLGSSGHPGRRLGNAYGLYQLAYTWVCALSERLVYRPTPQVVAVSRLVAEGLVSEVGLRPEQVTVIENGVDAAEFRPLAAGEPNALRIELGLDSRSFLLLLVGDIKLGRKNLELALRALPHLPPEVHLAALGAGRTEDSLALAARLGVAGRVHFLGSQRRDVARLMRGADAFVLPAHYDPFPLVVLEALASGIPVIVSPQVGTSRLLRHGENGLVLNHSDDLDGLVAAVQHLRTPERACAIAAAGRALAERRSWQQMADHYELLYRQIVAAGPMQSRTPPQQNPL